MYTIVLLVEKALNDMDAAEVTNLHEDIGPQSFVVLVPADTEHRRFVEVLNDIALGRLREAAHDAEEPPPTVRRATEQAQGALKASIEALRAAGAEATGEITPDDPIKALKAAVGKHGADEVIVLTEPHLLEETLHRDWASRARHVVGVPVLKLLAHSD
jgi:hypothetical protein